MNNVRKTIDKIDQYSANYGLIGKALPVAGEATVLDLSAGQTNYSINQAIQALGQGKSTFQVSIKVKKTGTGSGNDKNPVFLFGASAFNNAARPYNSVVAANQTVTTDFKNNKNVLIFKYKTDDANYTEYTISLVTKGEYPFVLGQLTGANVMHVAGMQVEVADAEDVAQLKNGIATFALDKFGFASTNDLTTPKDLYQQSNTGVIIPHPYEASGSKGIYMDVNEVDGMEVLLYMYAY